LRIAGYISNKKCGHTRLASTHTNNRYVVDIFEKPSTVITQHF